MNGLRRVIKEVLHRNRVALILWCTGTAAMLAVSYLYGVPVEPALYASALTLFFLLIFLTVQLFREKQRHTEREHALNAILSEPFDLPEPDSLAEEDYRQMVIALGRRLNDLITEYDNARADALDYYTGWVHRIKTPIAVMRLKLNEDSAEDRALGRELFRIERYAEMALQYVRLDGGVNDLLIRSYPLDELICEAVRKFAPYFIEKKLSLDYTRTETDVITDRKWLVFILEQLLSNAVKYTPRGTVSIRLDGDELCVADTGAGIAPEDLPRIFEKGYTGVNGRIGEKSSGLGLYLAKKAADLINVPIRVQSTPELGSTFRLKLNTGTDPVRD